MINLDIEERKRVIEAEWPEGIYNKKDIKFRVSISIETNNKPGIIYGVSKVFSEEDVDIETLNTQNNDTTAFINVTIKVNSKDQLERLTNKLLASEHIYEIRRITT